MSSKKEDISISELDRLWGKDEPWILIQQQSRGASVVLTPDQVDYLNQKIQTIVSSNHHEDVEWMLKVENWPALDRPDDKFRTAEALSLLIAAEFVIPLAAKTNGTEGEPVAGLYVNCSDVFFPAADAEPLPLIGFSDEDNNSFWELYHLCQKHGFYGLVKWCALKRNMLPFGQTKATLKRLAWCDRLQKIQDLESKGGEE